MTQHELVAAVRVVPSYDVDTLGAPFKVTLIESVRLSVDPKTGKEMVEIPDVVGLIAAVVRTRVIHPRKLNGDEIKFIRNALCIRAKVLAEFLDMSPEHLSRCEAGTKVMSPVSERMLRLFAYLATFYKDPEELIQRIGSAEPETKPNAKDDEFAKSFIKRFISLKIQTVFDPADELHFEFVRRARHPEADGQPANDNNGEWSDAEIVVA